MKMQFLFPSDYFNPKLVDAAFSTQVAALHHHRKAGSSLGSTGEGFAMLWAAFNN